MESSDKNQQIFKQIGEICVTPEFNQDQMDFFTSNCKIFSDEEENKLEYTNVYEAYVKLMEQLIEVKIKQQCGHSDEDLQAFYESIKSEGSIKTYQESNSDALDILYGFLDFDKFKASMLAAKKGMVDKDATENMEEYKAQASSETGISLEDFNKLFNEDLNTWSKKLEEKKMKDGVQLKVHQRKNPPRKQDLIRIDAVLANVDGNDFMNYFKNPPMDDGMLKEMYKVDDVPDGEIYYFRMKMPMMSERDNICQVVQKKLDNGDLFISCTSVDRAEIPPKKGVVRMYQHVSGLLRQRKDEPNTSDYTEFDVVDLGGYIPSRLMNMVMASTIKSEFRKFYDAIRLDKPKKK